MIQEQAEALLSEVLAPLTPDDFFDAVSRRTLFVKGAPDHPRRKLLGDDPAATLLAAYATHSGRIEGHSPRATQPAPPAEAVSSEAQFRDLVDRFHDREYTVRLPDIVSLSPPLQRLTRALECLIHQPVETYVFWSKAGAGAVIHYDNRDNIIVQLDGRKRWFISTDPPGLQNNWKQVGEPVPNVQNHQVVDLEPGDLIYIPRGTPHTVDSATESLHLSILFRPLTLRETIIAALDYLSDHDRSFREPVAGRMTDGELGQLGAKVAAGIERLLGQSGSDAFVRDALHLRSSRAIKELPPLVKPSAPPPVLTAESRVRHAPLAVCHLRPSFGVLDFSHPGGHIAIHPGVERELRFIASTPEFRVGDIPGQSALEVRIALVTRLVASGFLEVVN